MMMIFEMFTVDVLDKVIAYLQAERDRIYSNIMKPFYPKKESERKP